MGCYRMYVQVSFSAQTVVRIWRSHGLCRSIAVVQAALAPDWGVHDKYGVISIYRSAVVQIVSNAAVMASENMCTDRSSIFCTVDTDL